LQGSWNSLGESVFDFEVLDVLDHETSRQTDPAHDLRVILEMRVGRLEDEGHWIVTLQAYQNRRPRRTVGTGCQGMEG